MNDILTLSEWTKPQIPSQTQKPPPSSRIFVLQPGILGLPVGQLAQRAPLVPADPAHAQPRLLDQLHLGEGPARGAQVAELGEEDGHGELAPELDVHQAPPGLVAGGLGVVVWRSRASGAL